MTPSEAWIAAAKRTDRRPVLLMQVESVDALYKPLTTQSDWEAGKSLINLNATHLGNSLDTYQPVILSYWDSIAPTVRNFTLPWACGRVMDFVPSTSYGGPQTLPDNTDYPIYFTIENSTDILSTSNTVSLHCYTTYFYGIPVGHSVIQGVAIFPDFNSQLADASLFIKAHIALPAQYYLQGFVTSFAVNADAASTRTRSIDMGIVPSLASNVGIEQHVSGVATIHYTARGSNDDFSWGDDLVDLNPASSAYGTTDIIDGSTIAAFRYYDFFAVFSGNGIESPVLNEISVSGGDRQVLNFSTHEDVPMRGARPFLINSIGALNSKLELMKLGSTGEVSPRLYYLRETFEMLRDNQLRNKTVAIKHGFLGLSEVEYQPLFTGVWHDGSIDHYKSEISVKTRTIMARFQKAKVPKETASGAARNITTVVPKEWINVNIITAMMDVIDYLGISARYVDTPSAVALRDGARSGSDWQVSRRMDADNKEDALKLLEELSVLSGVFVVQRPDGKLTFRLYDPASPISGEIATDIATFSPVEMGQADLYTRQQIYYEPRHEGDLETGSVRGAWAANVDVARNDSMTVDAVTWYCIQSHQTSAATAPGTGSSYRAFWTTDWVTATNYVAGDVRISGGPLYTCSNAHTSAASTEPGRGDSWRAKWTSQPIKSGNSDTGFHSAYVLINAEAEINWGLNKDIVDPGDPDYLKNPGYQKQWFDKWQATPVAIAALAVRMDEWFANPKMRMKASDLPPQYFDDENYGPGCYVGITGLQLPVAGAEWGDLTVNKKFMIMLSTFDPTKCTVSFELLEV